MQKTYCWKVQQFLMLALCGPAWSPRRHHLGRALAWEVLSPYTFTSNSPMYARYHSSLVGQYEVIKTFSSGHVYTTRVPRVGPIQRTTLEHQL